MREGYLDSFKTRLGLVDKVLGCKFVVPLSAVIRDMLVEY